MLTTILFLYLQSLLITILAMLVVAIARLSFRAWRKKGEAKQARQNYIYDTIMITIMTIPILSFATFAVLMMLKV